MVMTRTAHRELDSEENLRCSGKIRCIREAFLPLEYGVPWFMPYRQSSSEEPTNKEGGCCNEVNSDLLAWLGSSVLQLECTEADRKDIFFKRIYSNW